MNKIKLYNDYSSYLKSLYKERIQKVSIDAGLTCPNRDGSKSTGGCIYCDNETFRPFYCTPEKSISRQITEGITFFSKKYKTQNYFAYFQSYSNTYTSIIRLKEICEEALDNQKIIGIILATRPDCIDEEKLQYLEELAKKYYISIEYGIETFNDKTLALINRHHSCSDINKAITMTAGRGINIGVHLILGLPGEDYKIIINNAKLLSKLPVNTVKLHQMQIIKNTKIEKLFNKNPDLFIDLSIDKYIDLLIDFIELLDKNIIIERFISEVPVDKLIYPKWGGLKNFEIVSKIEKRMVQRNSYQGSKADF